MATQADFDVQLIVSGTHLSEQFGHTVDAIEKDGFRIAARIPMDLSSDAPEAIAASIGQLAGPLAAALNELQPDLVLVVGDRLELLAAALAALALRVPVAHVSGGDVTEGALDNQVRHAMTQLSHVHFVAMEEHAERLRLMGEEAWRVHVTGDPALDFLKTTPLLSREELAESLKIELKTPLAIFTHHPTTLGQTDATTEIQTVLAGLEDFQGTILITAPNADAGGKAIAERLQTYATERPGTHFFESLGQLRYYSTLRHADVMIGNSSGGIWETPSFALPTVNIGDRQKGRLQAANVIDAPCRKEEIAAALRQALAPEFRASLRGMKNPYGDGNAGERALTVLRALPDRWRLLQKSTVEK